LHDVGHLPYSHIFEFALFAAIDDDLEWKSKDNPEERIRKGTQFVSLVRSKPPGKLHEYFGEKLMEFLGVLCKDEAAEIPIAQLMVSAKEILHGDSYPVLKSFISGDVDADRIDFIRRDTEFSGLLHSAVDYDRLFAFFQLQKAVPVSETFRLEQRSKPNSDASYVAAPSTRTISDIEKLLSERFQDYKYIACHHRVHLNDELLDRCIVELSRNGDLQSLFECMSNLSDSGAHRGKIGEMRINTRNMMALLTEFDDAWLEMKFREIYRGIHAEKIRLEARGEELLVAYVEGATGLEWACPNITDSKEGIN
jgi:HD superfamily phosphohydrolase